ncbi:serine hydrolase [Spiroplasma gladiatoris]|uniref:Serine hydrolase n=1 Tax=Spiroplasma gladiatoris TaxID=2143 RepID=A0A4V1AQ55_9MOLU|nr:serine hydrolase [Spiroplasma gladiatoris]QBQ07319.1 serine hydrolase [Spiroplasma gladiatoris]
MNKIDQEKKSNYKLSSSQEWQIPHLGRIFFARLIDLTISSIPMIILLFLYKVEDWKSATIVTTLNITFLFLYFVLLPIFLKGNTIGKLILNLRLKKENLKINFWDIFCRETYFVFIPTLIQILFQIITLVVFITLNKDKSDETKGKESITLLQNISYLVYVCWYLYIIATIALQKKHQAAIDVKRKIIVKHKVKILKIENIKKEKEKKHSHLKDHKPGLINVDDIEYEVNKMKDKFKNSNSFINNFIKDKFISGAVIRVCKNKKLIYKNTFGLNDIEKNVEMKEDLLFRTYSMTKPLTVVAFLLLVQNNKIYLDTKLEDIYEEFKNTKVLKENNELEDQKEKITMHHLLTMTAGFTYHGIKNETEKLTTKFLKNFATSKDGKYWDYKDFCKNLAKIPLAFQPGTNWYYGIELDVIAAVIEKITGEKFYDYVKENIFEKLKMFDSSFYINNKQKEANVYNCIREENKNTLIKINDFKVFFQQMYQQSPIALGGAGLISTSKDYQNFLNFLIDGKDHNGNQLLDFKFIEMMSKDQLKDLKKYFKWTVNEDYSYGYGVRVKIENKAYPVTNVGEYGWGGLLGSFCLVDMKNKITMNLMISSKPGHNKIIENDFVNEFYKDLQEENLN